MKFIKADGSVEEGAPLTEATATLRDNLERYFHIAICHHGWHSSSSVEPCAIAANFLALTLNNEIEQPSDLTTAIEAELLRLEPR